ncbi:hypothetical protein [Prochlorococcus marinus]|uniref:hypothetical protein n=1 Tax=Prochlorococcus TaxID=1218 RepID=UPI0007B3F43A|nr:hypothetical protein [Prochlorococcus marinus]KZR78741.1 hypothetical protein PMIT1323_00005 [Prochlorococcus marinus str. MIT 1323]
MSQLKIHPALVLLGLFAISTPAARSEVEYIPFPTKEELLSIQLQAYACSRDNDAAACSRTRALIDPLLDHPRLPSSCKDVVWDLLQVANKVPNNSFQRRDTIDQPAKRLSIVCINPAKQTTPKPSQKGGLVPQQS